MTSDKNGRRTHCKLRLRGHTWVRGIDMGTHIHKVCPECGRSVMTHHVSCSPSCAFGPGLAMPPKEQIHVKVVLADGQELQVSDVIRTRGGL